MADQGTGQERSVSDLGWGVLRSGPYWQAIAMTTHRTFSGQHWVELQSIWWVLI